MKYRTSQTEIPLNASIQQRVYYISIYFNFTSATCLSYVEIFISHSSADLGFVEEELIPLLSALDIDYWYSKEDITSGEQWERSIKKGLESCDGLILVMSENSASSDWVRDEVNWAVEKRPGHLLPILHVNCNPIDFHIRMPRIQYIDYCRDERKARIDLIGQLKDLEDVKSRVFTVKGIWEGDVYQDIGPNNQPVDFPVRLEIDTVEQNGVKGTMMAATPNFGDTFFTISGNFSYERFFQFNYHSQQPRSIQFGAVVLELDSLGLNMTGNFVGYEAYTKRIITGEIKIKRVDISP